MPLHDGSLIVPSVTGRVLLAVGTVALVICTACRRWRRGN